MLAAAVALGAYMVMRPDAFLGTVAALAPPNVEAPGTPVEKPQFPLMQLEAQYQGPFEDTIIQRWRDPIDGRVCYLYMPVRVGRAPPDDGLFFDYGGNTLGSISCSGPEVTLTAAPPPAPQDTPAQ